MMPAIDDQKGVRPDEGASESAKRLDDVRILLVEDERIVRDLVVKSLKSVGVKSVTEVATAEDAWERLVGSKQELFHVLIADLTLPGASGGTLLRKLRQLPTPRAKTFPVIVLTGNNDTGMYKSLEPLGISSYLLKPVSTELLRAAVERAVYGSVSAPPQQQRPPATTARIAADTYKSHMRKEDS